MPREWRDNTYDEPDLLPRYNFVARNGSTALADVKAEISSTVIQEGDRVGAAVFNLVSEVDDDGTPLLKIDGGTYADKPGTIQLLHQASGETLPAAVEYGEPLVTTNGTLYVGNSTGSPVQQATSSDVSTVQTNLNAHINNRSNPHQVTTGQIGAATATDLSSHVNAANPHSGSASTTALNTHINNRSNPHQVTAAQTGAFPATGGTISGNTTISGTLTMGQTLTLGPTTSPTRLESSGSLLSLYCPADNGLNVVRFGTGAAAPVMASDFITTSDARLKSRVANIPDKTIQEFRKVSPKTYTINGHKAIGYIADDFEFAADTLIQVNPDTGMKGINLYALIALQGATIKNMSDELDEIKRTLNEKK